MEQLNWLMAAVFRVTGCLDVARVDFRLDADDGDQPYILEVNPLPGLYPGLSDLVLEAEGAGMRYDELINGILDAACARYAELAAVKSRLSGQGAAASSSGLPKPAFGSPFVRSAARRG